MLLSEIVDLSPLKQYAIDVVKHGGVRRVYLIGSATHSSTPKDIDLLYVLELDQGDDQDVETFIETHTNIHLGEYDSFFQVGNRFFHLAHGAGSQIVDNTEYAHQQLNRPKILLASL